MDFPWRRQWHPTPVLLPGKSHGRRSLVGCSPWGREESDTTEQLHFHFHALGKELATHSSVLAWRIPGMAEPGGLPSMGPQSRTWLKHSTEALSSSSDFPGDSVVKKLPAHAGVMSLIPDLGRPHVLWSNQICAPQLFSWFSRAWEPQILQSLSSRAHALQQEKARQWEARAPPQQSSPCSLQIEKKPEQQWRHRTVKNKTKYSQINVSF